MAVKDKLKHKIDITTTAPQNKFGESGEGVTNPEIPCYIDGRFRRVNSRDGTIIEIDYSILFLPDTDIDVGYTVSNGVDKDDNSLLPAGVIVGYEDSNHPNKGKVVREAFIRRN